MDKGHWEANFVPIGQGLPATGSLMEVKDSNKVKVLISGHGQGIRHRVGDKGVGAGLAVRTVWGAT